MRSESWVMGYLGVKVLLAAVIFISAIVFFFMGAMPSEPLVGTTAGGGFSGGFWHGFFGLWSAIQLLLGHEGAVYQVANEGGWYDFGYIFGSGCLMPIVQLVEVPGRILLGRRSPFEPEDPEKNHQKRVISHVAGAGVMGVICLVMFFVADAGTFLPAPDPSGLAAADVGWFSGLVHSAAAGVNLMIGVFADDWSIFQAGGGVAYALGFKSLGLAALGMTLLNGALIFIGPKD